MNPVKMVKVKSAKLVVTAPSEHSLCGEKCEQSTYAL